MEGEVKKSSFKFEGYRITRSLFEIGVEEDGDELSLGFMPRGTIYKDDSRFSLEITFTAKGEKEGFTAEVTAEANFKFENINFEEGKISPLFLVNAPAILFPYIRAYISTLTSLSGLPTVLLPVLNLTNMGEVLKNNISII